MAMAAKHKTGGKKGHKKGKHAKHKVSLPSLPVRALPACSPCSRSSPWFEMATGLTSGLRTNHRAPRRRRPRRPSWPSGRSERSTPPPALRPPRTRAQARSPAGSSWSEHCMRSLRQHRARRQRLSMTCYSAGALPSLADDGRLGLAMLWRRPLCCCAAPRAGGLEHTIPDLPDLNMRVQPCVLTLAAVAQGCKQHPHHHCVSLLEYNTI